MKLIPSSVTRKVARQILIAKKNSPHIFFAAGVVSVIGAAVLASRSTLKLPAALDEIENDINATKALKTETTEGSSGEYPIEELQMDTLYVYGKAGLTLVKLYAPAIIVGAAGIAMLTGSHVQLTRRNAALMAAYGALQNAYDAYRERVREQLGEEKELDIYHGAKEEKDGKEIIKVVDPNGLSVYARFFDEGNANWHKDPEINRLFIQAQQSYANNLLIARGHVFLNEVYDMLGLDRSEAGAVVGWLYNGDGDNYVSFGLYAAMNSRFINSRERSVLLDFNVDGVIYKNI